MPSSVSSIALPEAFASFRHLAATPTHVLRVADGGPVVLLDLAATPPGMRLLSPPSVKRGKYSVQLGYGSGAFTPDGTHVVLLRNGHEGFARPRIERVEVATARVVQHFEIELADPMGDPRGYVAPSIAVSPDGGRVLVTCGGETVSYSLKGTQRQRLAEGCTYVPSPDGTRVLVESSPGTFLVRPIDAAKGVTFDADAALWADDRHLVVLDFVDRNAVAAKDIDRRVIFRLDARTGKRTKLATLPGAKAFAANPTRFVAAHAGKKQIEVHVVELATGKVEHHVLRGSPSEVVVCTNASRAFVAVNFQSQLHVLELDAAAAKPAKAAPARSTKPAVCAGTLAEVEAGARAGGAVLGKGASAASLAAAERALAQRLPDDVRAFYRAHDGARGTVDGFTLLPLEHVVRQWKIWKKLLDAGTFAESDDQVDAGKGVQMRWWIPAWIPITHDGAGNHHVLDLAPAKGGTAGQILAFEGESGARTVVGKSLLAWLANAEWRAPAVARPEPARAAKPATRARRSRPASRSRGTRP